MIVKTASKTVKIMPTNINAPRSIDVSLDVNTFVVYAITTLLLENCGYQTDRKSYGQRNISLPLAI